jgi:hypothetical protein
MIANLSNWELFMIAKFWTESRVAIVPIPAQSGEGEAVFRAVK